MSERIQNIKCKKQVIIACDKWIIVLWWDSENFVFGRSSLCLLEVFWLVVWKYFFLEKKGNCYMRPIYRNHVLSLLSILLIYGHLMSHWQDMLVLCSALSVCQLHTVTGCMPYWQGLEYTDCIPWRRMIRPLPSKGCLGY